VTVLFLISSEGYYGVENMLVVLGRHLSQQGYHCVVGVFRNSHSPHTEVGERAQQQGLTVEIVPCQGRWDWNAVTEIRKLLVKHSVDVLHTHGYKADLYGYLSNWANHVGLLATSHNWSSKTLSMRAYAALDRLVLRRFDRVIVVSDVVGNTLRRWGVEPDKVSEICNGVDIERFERAKPTLRNEIAAEGYSLVGFVGRLIPDKGGALLLHAAHRVLAVRPKTKFVLVGEGPSRKEWEGLATQLGIGGHVVFATARDDMPGVYASFDMVVLPSLLEAMPMCLLEAMAANKPVIATRVGAVPKLIIPEETGLLVEAGDVNGLAVAILRLLRDPELGGRLGKSGHAHAAQHFSAVTMAKNYIGQYEQVLESDRRNGTSKRAALEVSCR
jgi:glycosyltransferase involved in cell wall biosynthesis